MLALVPLHTVFVLEYQVRHRPTEGVKHLLLEDPHGVAPAGTLYVPPRVAWTVFLVVAGGWLVANGILFGSLDQTDYFGLFLTLDFVRVALGLLTLVWVLLWYVVALTHLKQKLMEAAPD